MGRKVSTTEEFDADRVRPLPDQPRKRFSGIKELAASIREVGQSSPGIVTLIAGDGNFDAQLIDGERRLRACKLLGVGFRAEVVKNPADAFAASFAANFGKQDHDAIETASALGRLRESGRSIESLAALAGKSGCWVSQHLNLLKLHPDVQAMMLPPEDEERPAISFQTAQLLSRLDEASQLTFARKVVRHDMSLAAARRMILRDPDYQKADTGGRDYRIGTVEKIVIDTRDRIGVYLDMPGDSRSLARSSIASASSRLPRLSNASIRALILTLSAAIEARIPKLVKR